MKQGGCRSCLMFQTLAFATCDCPVRFLLVIWMFCMSLTRFSGHDPSEDAVNDESSVNALLCAIFAGDVRMVKLLVEHKADVNRRLMGLNSLGYSDTQTMLMAAIKSHQDPEMLSALIELRADVQATTRVGLGCAYLVRAPGQLKVLIEAKADLHTSHLPMGLSPLCGAAVWSCPETVAEMLHARCDPNPKPTGAGYFPLHAVALLSRGRACAVDVARVLLEGRADPNARALPESKFLFAARLAGMYSKIFGFASCSIATKTLASLPGLTPLGAAALVGDDALCRTYLGYGAENIANDRGDLPEDAWLDFMLWACFRSRLLLSTCTVRTWRLQMRMTVCCPCYPRLPCSALSGECRSDIGNTCHQAKTSARSVYPGCPWM